MKKYVVLSKIGSFGASEERQFDELKDAEEFKRLLEISKPSKFANYYIAEIIA